MAKPQRPTWFRVFLHQKPIFDSVPGEVLGNALKAAMTFFDTGELLPLPPMEQVIFSAFRQSVEESYRDFAIQVENGKKGGRPRKKERKEHL